MLDHGDDLATGRLEVAPTLVRLSGHHAPVAAQEPVTLRAEVVPVHPEDPDGEVPTGTVAFRDGHRLLGTARLDDSAVARLEGVRLPEGVHPLIASYGGDESHAAASSAPVPQAVVVPLRRVLVAVAAPERLPKGVVLRVELLDPRSRRVLESATGSVTFALDGEVLGSAPLRFGAAELEMASLGRGRYTARFHGDLEFAGGEGVAPPETVAPTLP